MRLEPGFIARSWWVGATLGALISLPGIAQADCPAQPDRTVVLSFAGDSWTDSFRDRVGAELRTALQDRGFAVCVAAGSASPPAVAWIRLHSLPLPNVEVTIEIRDAVTQKRIARDVDLGQFTRDSRALALAVASDELLRASWIELAFRKEPPDRPVPSPVATTVERDLRGLGISATTLGAQFAIEAYSEGERHWGGDLYLTQWFADRWGVELAVGIRRGAEQRSENGRIRGTAVGGDAAAVWRPFRVGDLWFGTSVGLRVAQVTFEGEADGEGSALTDTGLAFQGRIRLLAMLDWGPLALRVAVGTGVPFVGVAARDAGRRVTGVGGAELFAQTGAGFRF